MLDESLLPQSCGVAYRNTQKIKPCIEYKPHRKKVAVNLKGTINPEAGKRNPDAYISSNTGD